MPAKCVPYDAFLSKVHAPDALACWTWMAGKDEFGYGILHRPTYGHKRAHRYAYALVYGDIPHGLEIDHTCGVRDCVNPLHLEAVTHLENVRRAVPANTRKSDCLRGHAFDTENTYRSMSRGKMIRQCRACRKSRAGGFNAKV